jgi:hypothetical protein
MMPLIVARFCFRQPLPDDAPRSRQGLMRGDVLKSLTCRCGAPLPPWPQKARCEIQMQEWRLNSSEAHASLAAIEAVQAWLSRQAPVGSAQGTQRTRQQRHRNFVSRWTFDLRGTLIAEGGCRLLSFRMSGPCKASLGQLQCWLALIGGYCRHRSGRGQQLCVCNTCAYIPGADSNENISKKKVAMGMKHLFAT